MQLSKGVHQHFISLSKYLFLTIAHLHETNNKKALGLPFEWPSMLLVQGRSSAGWYGLHVDISSLLHATQISHSTVYITSLINGEYNIHNSGSLSCCCNSIAFSATEKMYIYSFCRQTVQNWLSMGRTMRTHRVK